MHLFDAENLFTFSAFGMGTFLIWAYTFICFEVGQLFE